MSEEAKAGNGFFTEANEENEESGFSLSAVLPLR